MPTKQNELFVLKGNVKESKLPNGNSIFTLEQDVKFDEKTRLFTIEQKEQQQETQLPG